MKKIVFFLGILILVARGFAQDDNKLEISGSMLTDERVLFDGGDWAWNENRLEVNFKKKVEDYADFKATVWLRNLGLPEFYSMSGLYNKNIIQPQNYEIRELYADTYGLLGGHLDMRLGKQIVNWGTADKINHTNNLNPYDFEDVLDFGRKRGVWAVKADFYLNSDFYFEGVYVPYFTPANLPVGVFSDVLLQNQLPDNLSITQVSDSLYLPEFKAENFTAGVKFKGFALNTDFSFSYVYGFDDLPLPYLVKLEPADNMGNFALHTDLHYYRRHILGFDFATNIAGIGFWGEAAAFLPAEEQTLTTIAHIPAILPNGQPTIIEQTTDSIVLDKKAYVKFVLGADYTFGNGFYANFQYSHGFFHERGDELNDYFFLRVEKSLFFEKLKLAPISGAFVITDWSDIQNNYALAYFPQVIYKPVQDLEITLSSAIFDGEGDNWFVSLKDYNMMIFSVKYSF